MNYIRLINRFYALNSEKVITPAATSLYFFLLQQCNRLGWPESFTLPLAAVMLGTELSASRIRVMRNLLVERGLIEVVSGKRKSMPATYRIVDVQDKSDAAHAGQRAETPAQTPSGVNVYHTDTTVAPEETPAEAPETSETAAQVTDYPLDDYFAPEQAQLRQTFIMELHRQNPQTSDDIHLRRMAREAVDAFRRRRQTHASYPEFISHLENTIRIINRKSAPKHARTPKVRRDTEVEYQQRQQQLRERVAQRLANCGVYLDMQECAPVVGDF